MTSLRSIFQTPRLISLSSQNGELILAQKNPLTLVSFSLLFYNPKMNLNIKFYDINGNLSSSINITQSVSLTVKNSDFSKITWNDDYNYIVSGWVQEILPQNQEQLDKLLSDFEYQLVPIGDVIITSPLDASGNLPVDIQTSLPSGSNTIGNIGIVSPLDANGNVKTSIQSPLPSGSNTIGNVGVISLPPLPPGTNNIGSVNANITSLPSLPSGSNTIGNIGIVSPLDTNGNLKTSIQSPLPSGTNTIGNVGIISLPPLPPGTNNIGSVNANITSLPSLPSGSNNIGNVGIISPLDTNGNIKTSIQSPLPSGSNTIGNVGVISLPSLPAGSNTIGNVGVISLPSLPAGSNNIGNVGISTLTKSRLGSITNYSASANTNVFSSNLTSSINGYFYITVVSNTSCVVNVVFNGITMALNSGNPINANAGYTFTIPMISGDTLNINFSSSATVSVFVDEAVL